MNSRRVGLESALFIYKGPWASYFNSLSLVLILKVLNETENLVLVTHQALVALVLQSLSRVRLFATPWTPVHQASLSFTISWSLLRVVQSVMLSNRLVLCHPLLLLPSIFPSIRVFSIELILHIRHQSIGASASASVLPVNIQDCIS